MAVRKLERAVQSTRILKRAVSFRRARPRNPAAHLVEELVTPHAENVCLLCAASSSLMFNLITRIESGNEIAVDRNTDQYKRQRVHRVSRGRRRS
ncbi:hypothetical protein EVAR_62079_1 [Eumeta japonica]|uniref:Uncharacterized protein n=1 Tax=Eumeta variegata TaxID=151549 RepID=A0A4C1Z2Y2_EUMVA|nr:hypothetical protein EVAR_62079_1 [Eumeta japonica]